MKISIIIPCYNEEDTLPVLFDKINKLHSLNDPEKYTLDFVLVDDGSRDKTLELRGATPTGRW